MTLTRPICSVTLRFIKHGEFLRVGDRFLFREGRVSEAFALGDS
jgi:GTPase